jgi:hypothetical protein
VAAELPDSKRLLPERVNSYQVMGDLHYPDCMLKRNVGRRLNGRIELAVFDNTRTSGCPKVDERGKLYWK